MSKETSKEIASLAGYMQGTRDYINAIAGIRKYLSESGAGQHVWSHLNVIEGLSNNAKRLAASALTQREKD